MLFEVKKFGNVGVKMRNLKILFLILYSTLLVLSSSMNVSNSEVKIKEEDTGFLHLNGRDVANYYGLEESIEAYSDWFNLLKWSPNGKFLASLSYSCELKIWSTSDWLQVQAISTNDLSVYDLDWSPDSTKLVICGESTQNDDDYFIKVWDTNSWNLERTIDKNSTPFSIAWSPNGETIVVNAIRSIDLIDTTTWELYDVIYADDSPSLLSWSPDGSLLASSFNSMFESTEIEIRETSTWDRIQSITDIPHLVYDIEWSPDGNRLAYMTGGLDEVSSCSLNIFGTSDWTSIKTISIFDAWMDDLSWSPDGNRIITGGGYENPCKIWNTNTWDSTQVITYGSKADIKQVDWSPDGDYIATGTTFRPEPYDGRIEIYSEDSDIDGIADISDDFPEDTSASIDTDNDGFPDEWNEGKSWIDSTSDPALRLDAFPNDIAASRDSDGDGYPGEWNEGYNEKDSTEDLVIDAFPYNEDQWNDSDGDGYGDNDWGSSSDDFPNDETQWVDSDMDGFGNNLHGNNPDFFPFDIAASKDSDGDGSPDEWNHGYNQDDSESDPPLRLDDYPIDPAASLDSDGDGFPDEWNPYMNESNSTNGLYLDMFPNDNAASVDSDIDGYPDKWNPGMDESNSIENLTLDDFPDDPSIYLDTDKDGSPDKYNLEIANKDYSGELKSLDKFPNDPAASEDTDVDGYPDEWNEGESAKSSTTGLKIDAFPKDPHEWNDSDGDGIGDNSDMLPNLDNTLFWILIISGVIVLFAIVVLVIILKRGRAKKQLNSLLKEKPS